MKKALSTAAPAVFLLILTCLLNAQPVSDRWDSVSTLQSGKRLYVEHDGGKPIKGRFVRASDQAITVRADGKVRDLPRGSISAVYLARRSSRVKRGVIGALAGAGAGFLIGAAAIAVTKADPLTAAGGILIGLPAGAAIGAATGGDSSRGRLIYSR